jgi:hypothetical protein
MRFKPKGAKAARLRQRKFELAERYNLPPDALGGTLSHSRRRCGKDNCHCASGEGHPVWTITFMAEGKRNVHYVPADLVDEVRTLVDIGRECKQEVKELLAINDQLYVLWRQQQRKRKKKKPK